MVHIPQMQQKPCCWSQGSEELPTGRFWVGFWIFLVLPVPMRPLPHQKLHQKLHCCLLHKHQTTETAVGSQETGEVLGGAPPVVSITAQDTRQPLDPSHCVAQHGVYITLQRGHPEGRADLPPECRPVCGLLAQPSCTLPVQDPLEAASQPEFFPYFCQFSSQSV